MTIWRATLFSLFSWVLATPLAAQQIGAVSMSLGEAKEDVLARLGKHYDVVQPKGEGIITWWVRNDGDIIGSVNFSDGRLTWVGRDWLPPDQTAHSMVRAIGDMLHALEAAPAFCTVRHSRQVNPQAKITDTEVVCGLHSVEITLVELSSGQVLYQLEENWRR